MRAKYFFKKLSVFLILAQVFLVASSSITATVSALSTTQKRLINKNILYYDYDACASAQDATARAATSGGGAQPGKIYIMGDSITELAKDAYKKKFASPWKPTIEGLSSRQISSDNPHPSGLLQLKQDKDKIAEANAIVIALGTNGSGYSAASIKKDVTKAVSLAKSYNNTAPIYWVNIIDTRHDDDSKKTNKAISEAVGQDGTVIDWYTAAKDKADLGSFNEGVHPTKPADINLLVDTVYDAITKSSGAATPATPATSTPPPPPASSGTVKPVEFDDKDSSDTGGQTTWETDGSGSHANDGNSQSKTSFENNGKPLNADNLNFFALNPGWSSGKGIVLGDIAAITYKGKTIYAVYGDNHAGDTIHAEVSRAASIALKGGPPADNLKGVHFSVYPGTHKDLGSSFDQAKIDTIGAQVSGGQAPADSTAPVAAGCKCSGQGGGNSVNLSGSDNIEKALGYFTSQGFSPEQAAGIIGNFIQESGVNPKSVEGGPYDGGKKESDTVPDPIGPQGQPGYGIAQWTSPDRKTHLKSFAAKENKDVSSLELQLSFVIEEMKSYGNLAQDLKNIKGSGSEAVTQSAFLFHRVYEGSADGIDGIRERAQSGIDALGKFGSSSSGSTSSSSPDATAGGCGSNDGTGGGSSGEATGDYSLPVKKKFYDEHKEWFTKPHHDHPSADIPVPDGSDVYSMTAGKISVAPVGGECGNGVFVETSSGVTYGYCHGPDGGSVSGAKLGDTVKPGQLIMHTDNTGSSQGTHLHLQINAGGSGRCPQSLFVAIAENKPIPKETDLPTTGCFY